MFLYCWYNFIRVENVWFMMVNEWYFVQLLCAKYGFAQSTDFVAFIQCSMLKMGLDVLFLVVNVFYLCSCTSETCGS